MCPWASRCGEEKLMAFVAGKVRGPDGARLRAHVEDCRRCTEYVNQQKAIWQLLDEWDPEFAPAGFARDVETRLANLPPERWLSQASRFVMGRVVRPAFTVSAITALLAIGVYMRNPFVSSNPASFAPRVAAVAPHGISPVEAEQMDRAFDDMQLLHQLDSLSEVGKKTARSM